MIRKFLLTWLTRWYADHLDEIYKIDEMEQLKAYRFRDNEATLSIIKANITAQTLWHFEARTDEERWLAKGAVLMLKTMKDAHAKAIKIYDPNNPDKSLEEWRKYRKLHKTN